MRHRDLVKQVARQAGVHQRQVMEIVAAYLDLVGDLLIEGDEVRLPRIGTLWSANHRSPFIRVPSRRLVA